MGKELPVKSDTRKEPTIWRLDRGLAMILGQEIERTEKQIELARQNPFDASQLPAPVPLIWDTANTLAEREGYTLVVEGRKWKYNDAYMAFIISSLSVESALGHQPFIISAIIRRDLSLARRADLIAEVLKYHQGEKDPRRETEEALRNGPMHGIEILVSVHSGGELGQELCGNLLLNGIKLKERITLTEEYGEYGYGVGVFYHPLEDEEKDEIVIPIDI